MHGTPFEQLPVEFENVHLHRPTPLPASGGSSVTLKVFIHPSSGRFELTDDKDQAVVTGRVRAAAQPVLRLASFLNRTASSGSSSSSCTETDNCQPPPSSSSSSSGFDDLPLQTKDVYDEFRVHGYDYGRAFQGILTADKEGNKISHTVTRA